MLDDEPAGSAPESAGVGTVEGIHASTAPPIEVMTQPDDACPTCAAAPPVAPPFCPDCGRPLG